MARLNAMIVAALPGMLAGCLGAGEFRLHLVFPDDQAAQIVAEVAIWAADPGGTYQCDMVETTPVDPDRITVYARVVTLYPTEAPVRLPKVPEGAVMFLAEGYLADGGTILRGCVVRPVEAGETVDVTLELHWVCVPESQGEIPGNGEDDDCDGLTDECTGDAHCNDNDPCTLDRCDLDEERCVNQFTPNPGQEGLEIAGTCDDGLDNDCDRDVDEDDPDCRQCQTDADCDDGNPCTLKTCGANQHCETELVPNGTICDDGLYCVDPTVCDQGACTGPPRDCSFVIDPGDICNRPECNEDTNHCDVVPTNEGTTCNDGDACTANDVCAGGSCEGSAYSCDDDNPCTEDVCIGNGACSHNDLDGTYCDDGDLCTFNDRCSGNICSGTAYDCDDANPCTSDVCDGDGSCSHGNLSGDCDDGDDCTYGDYCSVGQCLSNAYTCDDGNVCTDNACDGLGGCQYPPNSDPCDDDDPCTMNDTCGSVIPEVCQGAPTDLDGDTHVPESCGGTDCDDADPGVHPDATEICNGIDDDCDSDTDTGACPAGCTGTLRNGRAYMFCAGPADWPTARAVCEGAGFKFVRVDGGSENDFIKDTCDSLGFGDSWLGGSDLLQNGAWRWTDGDVFWNGFGFGDEPPGMYANWIPYLQPEDNDEHCVEIYVGGVDASFWNDENCENLMSFICELY